MAKAKRGSTSRAPKRRATKGSASTVQIKNINVPDTKTRINQDKYGAVREAILAVVPRDASGVAFRELPTLVGEYLSRRGFPWEGSLSWYATTVKLDLEARGFIERVAGSKPQRLRRL